MVDREVFDRRLAKLEELLRDLRTLARTERAAFLTDRGQKAQAERWLQLAAECTLDLAHHLIAERGWKTPTTYRETFEILRAPVRDPDQRARTARELRRSAVAIPAQRRLRPAASAARKAALLQPGVLDQHQLAGPVSGVTAGQ